MEYIVHNFILIFQYIDFKLAVIHSFFFYRFVYFYYKIEKFSGTKEILFSSKSDCEILCFNIYIYLLNFQFSCSFYSLNTYLIFKASYYIPTDKYLPSCMSPLFFLYSPHYSLYFIVRKYNYETIIIGNWYIIMLLSSYLIYNFIPMTYYHRND